jgi:hypothetical protein
VVAVMTLDSILGQLRAIGELHPVESADSTEAKLAIGIINTLMGNIEAARLGYPHALRRQAREAWVQAVEMRDFIKDVTP